MILRATALLAVLTATALLIEPAQGVIHGPRGRSPRGGLIEPRSFEINSPEGDQFFTELKEAAAGERSKRQAVTDGIGTLFRLANDSHTHALVHWTGYPSEVIFILTRRRTRSSGFQDSDESWLWRSTDYGQLFVNDTTKWANDTIIEWYYISPLQEYLIFADLIHHKLWVTDNEGHNYTSHDVPFTPDNILFQGTTAPNSTRPDLAKHVLGYDAGARTLWASSNLGESWMQIGTGVLPNRYYWRVLDGTMENLTAVYFETVINDTHAQLNMSVDPYTESWQFDPNLKPFLNNTFVLNNEYMFVQTSNNTGSSAQYESPLWVSRWRQPFCQAAFPEEREEKHYWVVDASEGQVFMAVYHAFNLTNLYLSEEAGLRYSLSLEYIVSPRELDWINGDPTFDVHVVEGIAGTYIANRKVPGVNFGATVISFDKGGEWSQLTPPATDIDELPLFCDPPECSLHLHMDSDRSIGYKSILSQDSAIGLIMAQGNIGSTLLNDRNLLRLFFSHDGGFTWQTVESGLWDFQFAAIGSIIATVQWRNGPVNNVRWSCDEGGSWNITSFSDDEINVIGMLTERGERAQRVTIFGYDYRTREWLVDNLDFTLVVPDQCDPETDYYLWKPTDERPGMRCLLGESIVYERRESDVCCYIDPTYERPISRTPCVCTIEDFECDFGFERFGLNSPCTPLEFFAWPPPPPDVCPEGDTYNYTSGYRKVAGDQCIPGNETYFFPTVRACPIKRPKYLQLATSPSVGLILANSSVIFTLTQLEGGTVSTEYVWDFGDGTAMVNRTGLVNAGVQNHVYATPGVYSLTVTATNDGGAETKSFSITVLDRIVSYSVLLPIQLQNDQVPTGITLAFQAIYRTEFGTNITSDITYIWHFGEGTERRTSESTVSFAYQNAGNFTLQLHLAGVSVFAVEYTKLITVFLAAESVTITSEGLHPDPLGGTYAVKDEPITLTVVDNDQNERIPPDTFYSWYIVPQSGQSVDPFSRFQNVPELLHRFTELGAYQISVVGNYSGGSFHDQLTVFVECSLLSLGVVSALVVRSGWPTTVELDFTPPCAYSDAVPPQVTATFESTNGTVAVPSGLLSSATGPVTMDITLNSPNSSSLVLPVLFYVHNHVSNTSGTAMIPVLTRGDYGEIRLMFNAADLPGGGVDADWQARLKDSILAYIRDTYSLPPSLVAVPGIMFDTDTTTSPSPATSRELKGQTELLRRKREVRERLLLVDVDVLPTALTSDAIAQSKAIVQSLLNASVSGSLSFTVDGRRVVVSDALIRTVDPVVIIEPGKVDKTLVRNIGVGVGLLAVTVVVFIVVLVLVVYLYQKKYSRLRVRYSRLQQSPVRFTFTQGGEMVENDDDFDDEEMEQRNEDEEEDD